MAMFWQLSVDEFWYELCTGVFKQMNGPPAFKFSTENKSKVQYPKYSIKMKLKYCEVQTTVIE